MEPSEYFCSTRAVSMLNSQLIRNSITNPPYRLVFRFLGFRLAGGNCPKIKQNPNPSPTWKIWFGFACFGDAYSSLGGFFGGDLGGMMNSLGGMMGDLINAEVEILGDYGTVIKSFELGVGDTARITLEEGTALQIMDGACVLIAD